MFFMNSAAKAQKSQMVNPKDALPGRLEKMRVNPIHHALGTRIVGPFPDGTETALFGLGCFWGAERIFWKTRGVYSTAVGYAGGYTVNPTYQEVCSGQTGHSEVVLVVYDPSQVSYGDLVRRFFEAHNPTQGMRQGNDQGTQYRSAIYCQDDAQLSAAKASQARFQAELDKAGVGSITTEIAEAPTFYYAETYHQQYLAKNPGGYCGLGGTGVCLPPES